MIAVSTVVIVFVVFAVWIGLSVCTALVIGECFHRQEALPLQQPRRTPLPPTLTLLDGEQNSRPAVYDWRNETA